MELKSKLVKAALQAGKNEIPEVKKLCEDALKKDPDHLQALYATHILSLRTRDIDLWVSSLRDVFLRVPYHPVLIAPFLQHLGDGGNVLILAEAYIGKYPDEPHGYIMELAVHHTAIDLFKVRGLLAKFYRNSKIGVHFQPSLVASVFDASLEENLASKADQSLVRKTLMEITDHARKLGKKFSEPTYLLKNKPRPTVILSVDTLPGEFIGLDRAAVNGRITGATTPSTYFFRYGLSPDEMSHKTEIRQVPPGRFGRVKDIGSNVFRRINAFSLTSSFIESGDELNVGVASMNLEGPFGKDRDHLAGIGVIDLLLGWQTAVHLRGQVPAAYEAETFPKPAYPGEAIDLRDAEFTVTYRAKGLDTKEFYPVAWVHGGTGEAFSPDEAVNYAAWAYSDTLGTWNFIDDGKWHQTSISLQCNSRAWSFCGSNVEEMGDWMERICYHPIGDVLRGNLCGNICLCFVCGHELKTPEGDLELGALELSYRSYSLLAPDQETELVSCPNSGPSDPDVLTGGWIGTLEQCWRSTENPIEMQQFVWKFREDTSIQSIRFHQNPLWPSKNIAVSISDVGETFVEVWSGSLDDVPQDPAEWPKRGDKGVSFNFAKVVVFDKPIRGQLLRLQIKSGYQRTHWGLDAVEVFGDAPHFMPSPEPCTISEEITELEMGPLFVQLVTENESGYTEGEVIEVVRPVSSLPVVSNPIVIKRSKNKAEIRFRTNAMGFWGELFGEVSDENGNMVRTDSISIGKQEVAREAVLRFVGLKSSMTYKGGAVALNEYGKGELCKFIIPAEEG